MDVKTIEHLTQLLNLGVMWSILSIHDDELFRICFGSFMSCHSPNCHVISSNTIPREVVLSSKYRFFDFVLKSTIATRRDFFGTKCPNLV